MREIQGVARMLHDQALEPNSSLMQGKHTRRIKTVLSPTHTVHHAPHPTAPPMQSRELLIPEPLPPTKFEPNLNEMSQAVERRLRLNEMAQQPGEADRFQCEMVEDAEMSLRAISAAGYEVVLVAVAVPWVAEMALKHLQARGILGKTGTEPIHEGNVLF